MYVCLCTGMTCRQVKSAIDDGARSNAQVFLRNGVRPNCGRCRDTIVEMIQERRPAPDAPAAAPFPADLVAAE